MSAPWYAIANADDVPSPALLVSPGLVERNLDRMLETVGNPARLRPHIKTHKTAEVIQLCLQKGIRRFKCATIAEAELLGRCGAPDALLSYPTVGPQIARLAALRRAYPNTQFSCTVDHLDPARALSETFGPQPIPVWLDLDCGMHRTGVDLRDAETLWRQLQALPGLRLEGLHSYDGQIHEPDREKRRALWKAAIEPVQKLREQLGPAGTVRWVAGGTPTFPFYAELPEVECSPGTPIYWDFGYASKYPDLPFEVAAVLLVRVVSKPGPGRICLDLGYKAIAAESPHPRVWFPDLPDAQPLLQSEEHLVLQTEAAGRLRVGEVVYGIPRHICPTCALYAEAVVVKEGRACGRWQIAARSRRIEF